MRLVHERREFGEAVNMELDSGLLFLVEEPVPNLGFEFDLTPRASVNAMSSARPSSSMVHPVHVTIVLLVRHYMPT